MILALVASAQVETHAAGAQDRLPRPALPLHLAHRPLGLARPAPAAGVDDPLAAAGRRCSCPSRSRRELGRARRRLEPRARRRATCTRSTQSALTIGRGARQRRPDRRRRVRLVAPRALRAAARRRVRRGRRLDQRHLRQRHPPHARAPACPRRRRPGRRDRPEVRAMSATPSSKTRDRPAVRTSRDTGRKRRRNEDTFVCDAAAVRGRGRHGRRAGRRGRLGARRERARRRAPTGEPARRGAGRRSSIQEANRRVHQRALDDASASGMGTTMTVALFAASDGSVTIGHVGDSRAYRLRDGAARAAHRRPLARRRARPPRRALRGGGRGAPAALGDHARARHRPGRRRRRLLRPRPARRRLPALLGRPHDDGRRRARSPARRCGNRDDLEAGDARADHGGERPRRRRQHHRRAVRGRRRPTRTATRCAAPAIVPRTTPTRRTRCIPRTACACPSRRGRGRRADEAVRPPSASASPAR